MTPQEQLMQAKATELHLAFNAMEIRTPMEDMADGKQKLFESFLTAFAAQIEMTTREEDAKICDRKAAFYISNYGDEGAAACANLASLIRSKITKI